MRETYAARTLADEVRRLRPKAKIRPHGDPDGLGVVRSLLFDKTTGKWLAPILRVIDDRRIGAVATVATGLVVTFSPNSVVSDTRDPFRIADVANILGGPRA
jgi:hypothetical protein